MNRLLIVPLCFVLVSGCSVKKNTEESRLTFIDSPARSPSGEPYLITDDRGVVYLSWVEKGVGHNTFKFSTLTGNQWSEPEIIAEGSGWFVNWADYPMIAVNGRGIVAHYLEKSGEGTYAYDVKLTTSPDNGKTWADPAVLHDDGKQAEHGFVSLLPYKDNFFVAWLDGRNTAMKGMEDHGEHHGAMSLRAAMLDKDGKKLNEWELDKRTCDCCQTSAAITANGPIVVYRDRSDNEIRDMSIVRLIDGSWTAPEPVHADNWKIAGCPVNGPRVVAKGNVVAVAWFSVPEGNAQVNVIFSTDGGETFGKPVRMDEGSAIGRVDVVMLDERNVMISWMEGSAIKAARVNRNGTKGPSVTIASSSKSRSSGFPQITKTGDQIIFAWTDDENKSIKTASLAL